jgi:hypothetical protein
MSIISMSKQHTSTIKDILGLYLSYQAEDPEWRLSESQAQEIQEYKNILKRRNA